MDPYPDAGSVSAVPLQLNAGLRRELTVRDLLTALRRRGKIILTAFCVALLLATVKCIFSTRRYQANAAIQIQKDDSDTLGLESSLGSAESGASDALDYNITLQTEARVLASDTLALAVIQTTGLERNDDFTGKRAWLKIPAWCTPWDKPLPETAGLSLQESPERRRRALKTFSKHLHVAIEPGTRIIDISYLATDPKTASDVVNHLVSAFTEYNYSTRFAATAQVADWLKGQLDGLDTQARAAQSKVLQIQRETGLFNDDEQHNVVLSRLDELNSALVSAEENRILAQALDKVTATGDPEVIGAINAGGNANFSSNTAASLALIQQLRARESDLKAQLQQDLAKFGPNYPLVQQQRAQLQSVQQSLQQEVVRMAQRAHNDYQVSALAETASRRNLDRQKAVVEKLNSRAMEYVVAKEDADTSRDLLEDLKKKLADAKLLSGLRSSNVTIVDPGRTPSLKNPKQPNIPLTLAAGCFVGTLFGCAVAFIADSRDKRIHSAQQLEVLVREPPLALLPSFGGSPSWSKDLPSRALRIAGRGRHPRTASLLEPLNPDSIYAEALRSLRTSLLLSRSQHHPRVILITSAQPAEGKSTTALHLATILGQQRSRVLVIDADLRRPTLHKKLGIANERGLSSMLSDVDAPTALRSLGGRDDTWVLTAGPRPPQPAELLGSPRMDELLQDWRTNFDFILVDTPPVLPVTDAVLVAGHADIILLIARQHISTTHAVQAALRRLNNRGDVHNLGIVFNGIDPHSSDLDEYYGYSYKYDQPGSQGAIHAV